MKLVSLGGAIGASVAIATSLPACGNSGGCPPPPPNGPGVSRVDVGGRVTRVGAGEGQLWALRPVARAVSDLVQIAPASGRVVRKPLRMRGDGADIAVGEGGVWVAAKIYRGDGTQDRGVLVRVDPKAHRVVARIRVGRGPSGVAVGEGGVWVTSLLDGLVSRVDPSTNSVVATISVGTGARRILIGAGSVWVESERGGLHRIDPTTNRIIASRKVVAGAVGPHSIWVTGRWGHSEGLRRLDPSTLRPLGPVLSFDSEPVSVALAGRELWMGRLLYYCKLHYPIPEGPPIVSPAWIRLDPVTLRAVSGPVFLETSYGSGSLAYSGGAFWIATDFPSGMIKIDLAVAGRVPPTLTPGLPPPL
jgi:YVTN family beta-propeller protein